MVKVFLVILIVVFVILLSMASKQNKKYGSRNKDIIDKIKNRNRYDN